jgi:hypothetical protein
VSMMTFSGVLGTCADFCVWARETGPMTNENKIAKVEKRTLPSK